MNKICIAAAASVSEADLGAARLGSRFGRLDLSSQLALLAVEELKVDFTQISNCRIGVCLAAEMGSLSTDVEYWNGREQAGGPSPTLFAYTLPSSALGEIAIRHRLTGPNLCLVGNGSQLLEEASEMMRCSEAEGVLCVSCHVLGAAAAALLGETPRGRACALWLRGGTNGLRSLGENDRDMELLCAILAGHNSES